MSDLSFGENSYGIVKRLEVFRTWIAAFKSKTGKESISILDFGCGIGALVAIPLAQDGDVVHAVDLHEASIQLANERNTLANLTFSTETTQDLLARGAQFDLVICSEVLEHITNPDTYLKDFFQMLTPGGRLFVTVPNGFGSYEYLCRLEQVFYKTGVGYLLDCAMWPVRALKWYVSGRGIPPLPGRKPVSHADEDAGYLNVDSGHVNFFRLSELLPLFEQCGFAVMTCRGRTLLCGPFADFWLNTFPPGRSLIGLNNHLADRLPLRWAADWMFCLEKPSVGT